jgi:putative nucleotidyltransferase with HDIG domain
LLRATAKRYRIEDVQAGMELASSLVAEDGKFALGDGTVLSASLISRLKGWGIGSLDIREMVDTDELREKALSPKQRELSREYNETVTMVKKSFETIRFFKQVPIKDMRELADKTLSQFINTSGILNHLQVIHRKDDYTFHHSINVAVLSGVLGRWMGYRGADFDNLVLAGLLHDIGKTQVTLQILCKPGVLTGPEMDTMKLHTTYGYNLVKELGLPQSVLFAILQHHEREDGSGYPLRFTGDKIHPFAKIVAVADIYDAMTSDKVYRKKTTPFQAADTIVQFMYDKLDPAVCSTFLNNVRDYFIGNIVELSDGREAEVVFLGKLVSSRPIVKTERGEFIDLEENNDISIVKLARA